MIPLLRFRSWKNGVLTQFGSIDKSGEAALDPNTTDAALSDVQHTSEGLPRLEAFLELR